MNDELSFRKVVRGKILPNSVKCTIPPHTYVIDKEYSGELIKNTGLKKRSVNKWRGAFEEMYATGYATKFNEGDKHEQM